MFWTNQPVQIQSILQRLEQLHKTPLETALLRHCQQLELVNQQDGTELIRLRQGAATSPLLLNFYLDRKLDRVWAEQHPDVPLIRYLDDLLLIVPPEQEANAPALLTELRQLAIGIGFRLQPEPESRVVDLTHQSVAWLGYDLAQTEPGKLEIGMVAQLDEWLKDLESEMVAYFRYGDAVLGIDQLLNNLAQLLAPVSDPVQVRTVLPKALELAVKYHATEVSSLSQLLARQRKAAQEWSELVADAEFLLQGSVIQTVSAVAEPLAEPRQLILYTDGACDQVEEIGAYAYIAFEKRENESTEFLRRGTKACQQTTNNEMELLAVIKALKRVRPWHNRVVLNLDSQYVIRGIRRLELARLNSQNRAGQLFRYRMKYHRQLWRELERQIIRLDGRLTINKVESHTGNKYHDDCDCRAKRAIRRFKEEMQLPW